MLARALADSAANHTPLPQNDQDQQLLEDSARMQELILTPTLPARDRVAHILAARAIARRRLDTCSAKLTGPAGTSAAAPQPPVLQELNTAWSSPDGTANAAALLADTSLQDSAVQLIDTTEIQTSQVCGTPAGDDALLLQLATSPPPVRLPESTTSVSVSVPRD